MQHFTNTVVAFITLCFLNQACVGASRIEEEERLHQWLWRLPGVHNIPMGDEGQAVTVQLGVYLFNVVNANTDTNEIDFVIWPFFSWHDHRLRWKDVPWFANITDVTLDRRRMWIPDIMVLEQTSADEEIHKDVRLKLTSDGTVLLVPAKRVRAACDLAGIDSAEGALCSIRFISWTHDITEVDLQFQGSSSSGVEMKHFFRGSKYELLATNATRLVTQYDCCPNPYVELQYDMVIRKRR